MQTSPLWGGRWVRPGVWTRNRQPRRLSSFSSMSGRVDEDTADSSIFRSRPRRSGPSPRLDPSRQSTSMTPLIFKNARVFDGTNAECAEGMCLRVSDGLIQEISSRPITDKNARVIDVGGRTLMPGLIDAHTHAYCSDVSMQKVEAMGEPYRTAHAVRMLGHALDCGFTTLRDIGGGDYSLAKAIADGLVRAPR